MLRWKCRNALTGIEMFESFRFMEGKNLMKLNSWFVILLVISTVLLSSCFNQNDDNKRPIDGKLAGSVVIGLKDSVGKTPISVTINDKKVLLNENETKEIKTKMDALLNTLHPTHQLKKMPLKNYLTVSYQWYDKRIKLIFPERKDNNPQNQIYMKSIDPSNPDEYYLLNGEEKETLDLIDWLKDTK